jgi:hypothetical protein
LRHKTASVIFASNQNKPKSSEATTIGAQWGDGNVPESSDTMTRGATADSNEIKSSPSQSRMKVRCFCLVMRVTVGMTAKPDEPEKVSS